MYQNLPMPATMQLRAQYDRVQRRFSDLCRLYYTRQADADYSDAILRTLDFGTAEGQLREIERLIAALEGLPPRGAK